MKRFIMSGVGLSALLACSLLCSVNPAEAQGSAKLRISRIGRFSADPMLDKVVSFAFDKKGTAVEFEKRPPGERPQCTDLVNAALRYANAQELRKRPKDNVEKLLEEKRGFMYPDEAYVWGTRFVGLGKGPNRLKVKYQAGQILQFEYCYFEKPDKTRTWDMWHHTAIIKSANGTMVTLLHQNAGGDGKVREDTLDLTWLRPHAKGNGKNGHITVFSPRKK